MKLNDHDIKRLWDWTVHDIADLKKAVEQPTVVDASGVSRRPTNLYAIAIVSLMDIWGSVMRETFADPDENNITCNVAKVLSRLKKTFPDKFCYEVGQVNRMAELIRDNLIHSYGLQVLSNGNPLYHPSIDVTGPNNENKDMVISLVPAGDEQRFNINIAKLDDYLLEIIWRKCLLEKNIWSDKDRLSFPEWVCD